MMPLAVFSGARIPHGGDPENPICAFEEYFENVTDADFSFYVNGAPVVGLPPGMALLAGFRGYGLYLGLLGGVGTTDELCWREICVPRVCSAVRAKFYIHSLTQADDAGELALLRSDDTGLVSINPRRQASADPSRRMNIQITGTSNLVGSALSAGTWYEIEVAIVVGVNLCSYVLRDATTQAVVSSGALNGTVADNAARTVDRYAFYHQGESGLVSTPVTWDEVVGTDAFPGGAFHLWGDSLGVGFYASSFVSTAYAPLVADGLGAELNNWSFGNAMVADMATSMFSRPTLVGDVHVMHLGTNDMHTYEGNATKQAVYGLAHLANLVWLSTLDSDKVYAQSSSAVKSGTWANASGPVAPTGMFSSSNGANITFTVSGTVVYVCMCFIDPSVYAVTGQYTVHIDGNLVGTFNTAPGASILTILGQTVSPKVHRFSGLSDTSHTVVVTATSTDPIVVGWVAGKNNTVTAGLAKPKVVSGTVPRFNATGYSNFGGSDADALAFSNLNSANVSALSGDGLNVVLADTRAALNTTTDLYSDGLHWVDSGHLAAANTIIAVAA